MSKSSHGFSLGRREVGGIALMAGSLALGLSLLSYHPGDIAQLQFPPNEPPQNFIGPVGAWTGFLVFMGLGVVGCLLPFALAALGVTALMRPAANLLVKLGWSALLLVSIVLLAELQQDLWAGPMRSLALGSPGGALGILLGDLLIIQLIGSIGAGILAVALLLTSLVFLFDVHPAHFLRVSAQGIAVMKGRVAAWKALRRDRLEEINHQAQELARKREALEERMRKNEERMKPKTPDKPPPPAEDQEKKSFLPRPKSKPKMEKAAPPKPVSEPEVSQEVAFPETVEGSAETHFVVPPLSILDDLPVGHGQGNEEDHTSVAEILQRTLADFGIEAEVTNVQKGPVVTSYELLPAPGVRVERIAGLANNIALAMKAESIRVQAPIPGKGVVGIEIPNQSSQAVFLRELMESSVWSASKAALPLALGQDVSGRELVGDLADMPHLLIAGATGAGKSVCMNSILAGLLLSRTPDQLKLMLVDPKRVEFSGYNDLPHLVVPVINEAKKVGLGLRWAINEMEKRYKILAKVGVRNIKSFNNRTIATQPDMFESDDQEKKEDGIPARMPYVVIIIDELADLMMVAQAEVENAIARLAQLSRAVGIHMILATQRPSVNVITGTIKANFPARIAFQVAQKVDSRTILDAVGADKLLGKGDMLYLPPGSSKLIRAQGTMTTDAEIKRIVEFIKKQGQPSYIMEIKEKIESKAVSMPDQDEDDEVLETAIEIIRHTGRASTSSLQRRLRIGYTRAARLMDILEERGVVGPPRGSDPREILIDLDGEVPENSASSPEEPAETANKTE